MQKWEYKIIECKNAKQSKIEDVLSDAGIDGWELVSATESMNLWWTKVVSRMFFKRPLS